MNKKIVYVVILIECILAVFLISFFGQAIFSAVNKVPVQYVHFTYENGEKIADGVDLEIDGWEYQLYWEVGPDNAADTSVKFTSSRPNEVHVDETTGTVIFFEDVSSVTITVQTQDGSNLTDSIILILQNSNGGDVDI